MFNAAYLSQTLPYPFLSLFGDICSISHEKEEEVDEDEQVDEQKDEQESVAE